MNGIGGTLKNCVYHDVMFEKCIIKKWLPRKRIFSHNFMGKVLVVIIKLLLLITILVHAFGTMNQLKNCFSAQYVRFGPIATVSLIDNGQWN